MEKVAILHYMDQNYSFVNNFRINKIQRCVRIGGTIVVSPVFYI